MAEQEKKQERSFELRSEKVRSIVGQIPSRLVRYGISAIGLVLLCLFAVAWFLPYEKVYSGEATVRGVPSASASDSVDVSVQLRFDTNRPGDASLQPIYIQSSEGTFTGTVQDLSSVRDTLGRQQALCRFRTEEVKKVENQMTDFRIVYTQGSVLQYMLGGIGLHLN